MRQCELPEPGIKHPLANFIDKNSDLNPTPPVAAIIRLFGISKRLSVTRLGRGLVAIVIIANATIYLLPVPASAPRWHNRLFNLIRNHAWKKNKIRVVSIGWREDSCWRSQLCDRIFRNRKRTGTHRDLIREARYRSRADAARFRDYIGILSLLWFLGKSLVPIFFPRDVLRSMFAGVIASRRSRFLADLSPIDDEPASDWPRFNYVQWKFPRAIYVNRVLARPAFRLHRQTTLVRESCFDLPPTRACRTRASGALFRNAAFAYVTTSYLKT